MKEASNDSVTTPEDKRILNSLQLKVCDISQSVEILGKQLTNNQIKDIFANSYNIFCQMRVIYDHAGVADLYEVVKKMQVYYVLLTNLLAERIEKKTDQIKTKQPQPQIVKQTIKQANLTEVPNNAKVKVAKLGGINLYNQSYKRGLQYYQVDDAECLEHLSGKCHVKQSKKSREQFLFSVTQELDAKADVQVETIADEIKKYIKEYKQNNKINNFVSYQKELVEIIDFFKISQLQAITFLHKSPTNQEYTEDYINRLNDLEYDLKRKEKAEKLTINQKLKLFIINLREKLKQMEQKYQQKNIKLQIYEKSLKKSTTSMSTQTSDGYQSRLKSQQHIIKQLEQRYKFLSQIKNSEIHFESKYYETHHQLNIKVTEINKLKTLNNDLQIQIQYLKKIVRENKDKLNIDMKEIEKRRIVNRKIKKDLSKKHIQQQVANLRDSVSIPDSIELQVQRSSKMKKSKRLERIGAQTSSLFRPSQISQVQRQIEKVLKPQISINAVSRQQIQKVSIIKNQKQYIGKKLTATAPIPKKQTQIKQSKQSKFVPQFKKHSKKPSQQQRQVSFREQPQKALFNSQIGDRQSNETEIKSLSIDNIKIDDQYDEQSLRNSRKNTLRQIINSSQGCSIKSFDAQAKKSSKTFSKKCIILKDNKEKDKSMLATTIKFEHLAITDVLKLTIFPHVTLNRQQRPSYPFTNLQSNNSNNPKTSTKFNQLANQTNKSKNHHLSTQNLKKIKSHDVSERHTLIQSLKRHESIQNSPKNKKSLSKKENLPNAASRKKLPSEIQRSLNNSHSKSIKAKGIDSLKERPLYQQKPSKELATYIQNLKLKSHEMNFFQRINELPQQSWRGSSLQNTETNSFVNFIIDEISKQELNLDQFKEIATLLSQKTHSDCNGQRHKVNIKKTISLFKQFQLSQADQQSVVYSKKFSKAQQITQTMKMKESCASNATDFLNFGEQIMININKIHNKRSNCQNKDNKPCDHLKKYLMILKKLCEMSSQKGVLKLPIQKIGDRFNEYPSNQSSFDLKNSAKLQNLLQKSKKLNNSKPNLDVTIDQQKDRILPIINSTASTYYKPKGKYLNAK